MNDHDCTCGTANCYDCRRQLIDATALEIIARELRVCDGMTSFDIQEHAERIAANWRSQAINNLALEALHWN